MIFLVCFVAMNYGFSIMNKSSERDWCLILGASSGIGKACALSLSSMGLNIIGVHLDSAERQNDIDRLVDQLKSNEREVIFFNANAASDSARTDIVSELASKFKDSGKIKVFIHSLSFGALLPFIPEIEDQLVLSSKQMEMTLAVMAHSLVYWTRDLFIKRLFLPYSKVYALTSAGDSKVASSYGAVSAAKCALESHVRQLAFELAPYQISVNAIRAGVTITPSLKRIPGYENLVERAKLYNPHSRLTTPEDVGEAIALLSSSNSSWMTGNVIGVDGGEVLTV